MIRLPAERGFITTLPSRSERRKGRFWKIGKRTVSNWYASTVGWRRHLRRAGRSWLSAFLQRPLDRARGVVNACLTRVISSGHARNYERIARPKILPSRTDIAAREVPSSLFHSSSPSTSRASTRNLPSFPELSWGSLSSRRFHPPGSATKSKGHPRCWPPVRPISLLRPVAPPARTPPTPPENGNRTRSCAPILSLSLSLSLSCSAKAL